MARLKTVGKRILSQIIQLRSSGMSAAQTAYELGMKPWQIYYVSLFVKMCVSSDEYRYLQEEARFHRFGSAGEFVMDVFNRSYEEFYLPLVQRKNRPKKVA
jgi:hypothetical protein